MSSTVDVLGRRKQAMRITVVGAGRVGISLASAFVRVGHDVYVAVRSERPVPSGATAGPLGSAGDADVTVLAVPFERISEVAAQVASSTAEVIVDATNPFGVAVPAGFASGAAYLHSLLPQGVPVVKAFNVIGAEHMAEPGFPGGHRPVLPVAGTTPEARALIRELAEQIGFDAVDVGGLEAAGTLESAALYWGLLAFSGGKGRDFGLVAMQRETG